MKEEHITQVNNLMVEVREFLEKDEPWPVPLNGKLSQREVMDEYARFINYTQLVNHHLKNVDTLIHVFTSAKLNCTANVPNGQKAINQINACLEKLKTLHKALDDINDAHYIISKYFEKGGGLF